MERAAKPRAANLPNSGRLGAGVCEYDASVHLGNLAIVTIPEHGAIKLDDGDTTITISRERARFMARSIIMLCDRMDAMEE